MQKQLIRDSIITLLFALFAGGNLHAAEISVAAHGGEIQSAIDAAVEGDTVLVEPGRYVLSQELSVTNGITIRGAGGPAGVIIDGDGSCRVFSLAAQPCVLQNLTITGGSVMDENGAGIYCEDDSHSPVISNCVITANINDLEGDGSGGGVCGGTLISCVITDNIATKGGGVANSIVLQSRIEDNSAFQSGAGAYESALRRSTIVNNNIMWTQGEGGGLTGGSATYCAISGNNGGKSGGGASYTELFNCTITRNTALQGGGASHAYEIANCIVWHNTVTGGEPQGGEPTSLLGAAELLFLPPDSTTYVTGTDIYQPWGSVSYTCSPEVDTDWDGNINTDPLLASFSHITAASPCIGVGMAMEELDGLDIDGETVLDPPSMGCDEYHGVGTVTGPLNLQIQGLSPIAVGYRASYAFITHGAATLTVAEIAGGSTITNPVSTVERTWSRPGTYDLIYSAWNESLPGGVTITQRIEVLSIADTRIYVSDQSGDDANSGTSWAEAKKTIQAGIDAQFIPGGEVIVSNGVYNSEIFPIVIYETPLILSSVNGAGVTIIDAEGTAGCVAIYAPQSTVCGFTIRNGAIQNYFESGGGVYCGAPDAFVRQCLIRDNRATDGSGMFGGTAVNCGFLFNHSEWGSVLSGGSAGNSYFAYNSSVAIGKSKAWNCTVTANAGGVAESELYNCIVWGNTGDGEYADIGYGTHAEFTCSPDLQDGVSGNITTPPMLANCSHLTAASPCIGAGDPEEAFEFDIDGQAWAASPSMGCDEYLGAASVAGDIVVEVRGTSNILTDFSMPFTFIALGPVTHTEVDFGDGTTTLNPVLPVEKFWSTPGVKEVVFTAYNSSHPGGLSITQLVTVAAAEDSAIFVDDLTGDDTNPGTSWASAKKTIQAGIDAQMELGGLVLVSNGVYNLTGTLTIDKPLSLISCGTPGATVIDGQQRDSCITTSDERIRITGFNIINGRTSNYGGGINCGFSSQPVISDCVISNCYAQYGGGVAYGTVVNSHIVDNQASSEGCGLYLSRVINCLIEKNTPYSSADGGGAAYCWIDRSTIINNTASFGGGLYHCDAQNSLIANNEATVKGGGTHYGSLWNSTIVDNKCLGDGLSYGYGNSGGSYHSDLVNCIVYGNQASAPHNNNITGGIVTFTCSSDLTDGESGNITSTPLFVDALNNDFRLAIDSPCINTGNDPEAALPLDLDGQPRIAGSAVDMGAYERPLTAPLVMVAPVRIAIEVAVGNNPLSSTFEVFNGGPGAFNYTVTDDAAWLTCTPASGIGTAQRDTITVAFNVAALPIGAYTAAITVTSPTQDGSPRVIPVTVDIYAPEFDHLSIKEVASQQRVGEPFEVTLAALDRNNYAVPSFTQPVDLSGFKNGGVSDAIVIGTDNTTSDYPMSTDRSDSRTQVIYTQGEMGGACIINSLALFVATKPPQALNNWTIRMKHLPFSDYSTGTELWHSEGWTVVHQSNTTIGSTGWNTFNFATPFYYNGSDSLMVDFSFANSYWSGQPGFCRVTSTTSPRSLTGNSNGEGSPLEWSGSEPYVTSGNFIPNLQLAVTPLAPVAVEPTGILATNGVWSGMVTINTAGNITLMAEAGLYGTVFSNPLTLLSAGTLDSDGDGVSDADEEIAGTNPSDPESYFKITGATAVPDGVEITWVPVPGRAYSIYVSDDLKRPFELLQEGIPATGSYIDTHDTSAQPTRFYMLKVGLALE